MATDAYQSMMFAAVVLLCVTIRLTIPAARAVAHQFNARHVPKTVEGAQWPLRLLNHLSLFENN